MLERNKTKDVLIGVMTVAMIVISSVALYAYKNPKNVPQVSSALTNAEEVILQRQLAKIITDKNESDCATLTNESYRLACEQFFKPTQVGTQLQTSSAEPMTEAQLTKLFQHSSSLPLYGVTLATTTP